MANEVTLEAAKAFSKLKVGRLSLKDIKRLLIESEGEQLFDPKQESKKDLANRLYDLLHPDEVGESGEETGDGEPPFTLAKTIGISQESADKLIAKRYSTIDDVLLLAQIGGFPANLDFIEIERDRAKLEVLLRKATNNVLVVSNGPVNFP